MTIHIYTLKDQLGSSQEIKIGSENRALATQVMQEIDQDYRLKYDYRTKIIRAIRQTKQ